ncbi:MarR family winged helix-turn-helix transcriptional regulator [Sneathiella aquimaris]|uniref:MarR family winged helix-turn-helix transcriptional regulator n=1 Tax=Sneathiella aquimaris TaxID=2599305 RepID=UPI00146BC069|nr:MarR family transcriptional regulator [Sneathiella aquimaris]
MTHQIAKIPLADLIHRMKENWPEAVTPETEAVLGIIRLNDVVREKSDKIMASFDLTPGAFEVLTTLRAMPAPHQLTPTELYRSILISSGGMTKILKTLEENGHIERPDTSEDGRSKPVRLTPSGAHLAERSMAAVIQGDQAILTKSLSSKDTDQLRLILLQTLAKLE